jgi:hypothetical protein
MSSETIHLPVFNVSVSNDTDSFTLVTKKKTKKQPKEMPKEIPKEPIINKSISEQFLKICTTYPRSGASIKGKNFNLFYYQQPDNFTEYYSVGITIRKNRYTYMAEMSIDTFIKFFSNKLIDKYFYSDNFDETEFLSKFTKYSFTFVGDDCD